MQQKPITPSPDQELLKELAQQLEQSLQPHQRLLLAELKQSRGVELSLRM